MAVLRVVLLAQLLYGVAVTFPATAVAGYDTVMLAVPCPLTNVATGGTVQITEVALDGKPARL